MPLVKSTLAAQLENIFNQKPATSADAAVSWAQAYTSYAASALSTASSLPVTAAANTGILVGAFTSAFNALATQAAAAVMVQGVMAFWQAMVWAGPTAAGTTASPGNAALAGALGAIFSDTSDKTASDKASELADAFDAGAKLVIVSDIPFAPPPTPIVGPIQ